MKKIFSKILIATFVLSFFLAPVQGNISISDKKITIEANKVFAATFTFQGISGGGVLVKTGEKEGTFTGATLSSSSEEATGSIVDSTGKRVGQWKATSGFFSSSASGTWVIEDSSVTIGNNPTWSGIFVVGTSVPGDNALDTQEDSSVYGCTPIPTTWHLCIISWIYQLIFQPVAFFARLAAQILDFFIYYSISSDSYGNNFIEKGWGIMRDIANVFFIVALIYVAVKTILDLNSSNNKRMIGMIIVVALLINFSLFATKVVIDASNILARVFYANIESVDKHGVPKPAEDGGEKSITVGLVKQFDPHTIFGTNGTNISDNPGTFAAILFLSILMMGYMVFMFLSVTLLFVSRVVMLWILMIMSPIAFISMTMPGVKIPSFNFSEWWSQLSDNAFLAPIFIFFLYLIITFGDIVKVVTGIDSNSLTPVGGGSLNGADDATFAKYMGVVIPFILIFILLATAKKIAVKMSGEMGSMINKAGAMVGGFAGGAVLGGAALVGTRAVGGFSKYLSGTALSESLRDKGVIRDENGNVIGAKKGMGAYFARMGLKTVDYGQKASFDARKTGLGKFIGSKTGLNFQSASAVGLGSKEGGFSGVIERKAKEQEKEKELYKTSLNDTQVKEYTLKRRENFLKEKADEAEAKERKDNKGVVLTDAQIQKVRNDAMTTFMVEAPKVYGKAADLNKERMIMFQDRLGQSDLLSSLAHTGMNITGATVTESNFQDKGMHTDYLKAFKAKKKKKDREEKLEANLVFSEEEFEKEWKDQMDRRNLGLSYKYESELGKINTKTGVARGAKFDIEVAKTMNDKLAKDIKMVVGAGASLASGGLAGSMMTGVLAGGLVGAGTTAVVGSTLAGQSYADDKVVEEIRDSMAKEAKNAEKLADRIQELNNTIKKGKLLSRIERDPNTLNPITNAAGEIQTRNLDLFMQNNPERIDKEKLRDAIANNKVEEENLKNMLKDNPTGPHTQKIKDNLKEILLEKEVLDAMKTVEGQLFDLTGKRPNQGGSSAPTPPPTTP